MNPPPEPDSNRPNRLAVIHRLWDPAPIDPPTVDPNLQDLPWPSRSAEVLRYSILSVEHWLSQGGSLREFIRLNLWFGVILTVAAVLIVPPVTMVLEGAARWSELLSAIIGNIASIFIKLPPIIIGIATAFFIVRWLGQQSSKAHSRHDRHHSGFDDYH